MKNKYLTVCKKCRNVIPKTNDMDNEWFREYCLKCISDIQEEQIRKEFNQHI